MSIVVLDIGKTHAKAVLLDESGREIVAHRRRNEILAGPPYPHHDAEELWRWAVATLAMLPERDRITTIVPIHHGCAGALLAGDTLALPLQDYEFTGPDDLGADFDEVFDPFDATFSPPLPLGQNFGRQVLWQQEWFPNVFARVTDILPGPQYWAWLLSGVKAVERTSLGAHSHLWRPLDDDFSGLVDRRGWRPLFPPLRRAWDVLGPIRPDLARTTGLPADCRVLVGMHDSNAALLPHLIRREGSFTVVSTGTWIIVMAPGSGLKRLDPALDHLAGVDVFGRPVPTARAMGGREFEILAAGDTGEATEEDLDALLASGAMALPSFHVESGPFMGREGRIVGTAGDRHIALASLYVASMIDVMMELLGAEGPIIVDGPFARNDVIMRTLATWHPDRAPAPVAGGVGEGALLLASWPCDRARGHDPRPATPFEGDRAARLHAYRRSWRERVGVGEQAGADPPRP
ncbi:MAG: hypothetical protein KDE35_13935 [Geminicoccaceae bacterium]|nr:hypothetical protein [Geminicoccaceae bacterium]